MFFWHENYALKAIKKSPKYDINDIELFSSALFKLKYFHRYYQKNKEQRLYLDKLFFIHYFLFKILKKKRLFISFIKFHKFFMYFREFVYDYMFNPLIDFYILLRKKKKKFSKSFF